MTREIPLTKGAVALVDDADERVVQGYKWHLTGDGRYAGARTSRRHGHRQVYMHRLILGASADVRVDHINGDGLDNRRVNLRLATHQENNFNRKATGPLGFKGVFPNRKRFAARITR